MLFTYEILHPFTEEAEINSFAFSYIIIMENIPILKLTIDDVPLGSYTAIIHFLDENGQYLRDARLPMGHRQNIVVESLPYNLVFQIPSSEFELFNIQLSLTLTNSETTINGKLFVPLFSVVKQKEEEEETPEKELVINQYIVTCL